MGHVDSWVKRFLTRFALAAPATFRLWRCGLTARGLPKIPLRVVRKDSRVVLPTCRFYSALFRVYALAYYLRDHRAFHLLLLRRVWHTRAGSPTPPLTKYHAGMFSYDVTVAAWLCALLRPLRCLQRVSRYSF